MPIFRSNGESLTLDKIVCRSATVLGTWLILYVIINGFMSLFNFVNVVLGIENVRVFRPVSGPIREAYRKAVLELSLTIKPFLKNFAFHSLNSKRFHMADNVTEPWQCFLASASPEIIICAVRHCGVEGSPISQRDSHTLFASLPRVPLCKSVGRVSSRGPFNGISSGDNKLDLSSRRFGPVI